MIDEMIQEQDMNIVINKLTINYIYIKYMCNILKVKKTIKLVSKQSISALWIIVEWYHVKITRKVIFMETNML